MSKRTHLSQRFLTGPFTTSDLLSEGISKDILRGRWITTVTRGAHVAGEPDDLMRLRALSLVLPADAVFSCQTAGRLWSLPLGRTDDPLTHVRSSHQVRRAGVTAHRDASDDVVHRQGVLVTGPTTTFLDLAAHLDDRWLLAAGDAIVRRGFASTDDLVAAVAQSPSRRGIARARRVAPLVRADVDSPMESLLRLILLDAGLPEPVINRDVTDSHGGWIARPDLTYPDRRIAIEYDGRHHYNDLRQWENDIARRHNLEDDGWIVRIATARDVFVQPERFGADLLALYNRRP